MFKRLLVPTDFSNTSINALRYVVPLAKKLGAEEVMIMYAYVVPVAYAEKGVTSLSDKLRKEQTEKIEGNFKMLKEAVPELESIPYSTLTKQAMLVDALISLSLTAKIDLIVMGTTGATGIDEMFFGTNSYTAVKETNCPVLIIPEKVSYTHLKQIVLASDYKEMDTELLEPIKIMSRIYGSTINIVHIHMDNTSEIPSKEAEQAKKLARYFKNISRQYHYIKNTDVEKGLEEFIEKYKVDLLTLIPRRHSLFQRIFGSGESKNIIFHTKIPLLALPEKR